jgi:hypothetical protein
MTGMDTRFVPDPVQATYDNAQLLEAVENVPIYRTS